ncbi:MAG: DUF3365 domain-containing protein [Bacteroidota bacterium]
MIIIISCNSSLNKGKDSQNEIPISLAENIVGISQQTLVKTVSQKISEHGAPHAITFCNENALPLMDSISNIHGVAITRVSEKYRNPMNKPSKQDMIALKALSKGNIKYYQNKNASIYYAPIRIGMPTCLKCHGEARDIDTPTLNKIKELYPSDKAVDYKIGEFRGAWMVSLAKK